MKREASSSCNHLFQIEQIWGYLSFKGFESCLPLRNFGYYVSMCFALIKEHIADITITILVERGLVKGRIRSQTSENKTVIEEG